VIWVGEDPSAAITKMLYSPVRPLWKAILPFLPGDAGCAEPATTPTIATTAAATLATLAVLAITEPPRPEPGAIAISYVARSVGAPPNGELMMARPLGR
jgi:hypothetical protein